MLKKFTRICYLCRGNARLGQDGVVPRFPTREPVHIECQRKLDD